MDALISSDVQKAGGRAVCFAFANGCPRSTVSMGLIVEFFKANGWRITNRLKEADIVLIASCSFDAFNEEKGFRYISLVYRKKRPDARLIVFGCLPGINRDRLLDNYDVTAVPSSAIASLNEIIDAKVKLSDVKGPNDLSSYEELFQSCFSTFDKALVKLQLLMTFKSKILTQLRINRLGPQRPILDFHSVYEIKVGQGCLGRCSYCAIKFADGPLTSKPIEKVMEEFNSGLKAGYSTFRLIGSDVGAYGQDAGTNIAELLRRIFETEGDFKLIWADFSPNWLIKYFPELSSIIAANAGRIGYLGFPVQSGSDRVLELMRRDYRIEDARKCLSELKKASPGLMLTTHVLFGFPGEDESDFKATMDFLKDVEFRHVQVYKYADRPNAPSVDMPGKVSDRVKARRIREFRSAFPA